MAENSSIRSLAEAGQLVARYREASTAQRRALRAAAAEIAGRIVFNRVTRPMEHRRRHPACASGLRQMAPECLDRYHDDVDAVLDDLFAHADRPIANLEGWITARLRRSTVDAHRRRRGERGAQQRPRPPAWLIAELGGDPWRVELARAILEWVGVEATAGRSIWPLTAWTERRTAVTGAYDVGESAVAAEVEAVLAAMRRRRGWYEKNVERPLGRKEAAVWFPAGADDREPESLALVAPHERDDAELLALAARAIELIAARMAGGEKAAGVVPEVLTAVFGELPAAHGLDRAPGADRGGPEEVVALIGEPARLRRIIATVVHLLGDGPWPGRPDGS
ncbi:hypothetical protein ODJ79_34585 [Actinoplanes sp. KI2]|uniref:hypothetical protein n=1 Tax=Actinoplanes sp. KI2 TaxID=2983315 RepID=UPI0021D60E5C|nr:hypothetical protein [Actinoplanes sp. KI2]MCU7728868.1 hypothetical protein [Actinoplanes sp. KI2]